MSRPEHHQPREEWDPETDSPHEIHDIAQKAEKPPIPEGPEELDGDLIAGALSDLTNGARERLAKSALLIVRVIFGGELIKLKSILKSLEVCRKMLTEERKATKAKLNRTDHSIRINEDAPPLSWIDYATICLLIVICLGLVTIAYISTPAYMLNFVTESYALAYSTAFLGLALPVGLHTAASLLGMESARKKFLATICVLSFIFVTSWIMLNAYTYGGLMLDETAELPPAKIGITLMMLAMLAEGFTTAAGWLGVEHIISKRMKTVPNPEHILLSKQYERDGKQLAKTHGFIAAMQGRISAMESAEKLYVDRTLAVYDRLKQLRDFPRTNEFPSGTSTPKRKFKPRPS